MTDKNAAFEQLDNEILPAVKDCLRNGLLVVLIGATCSGKSVLAKKALPSARLISGLDAARPASNEMASDMIGEELYDRIATDESIRYIVTRRLRWGMESFSPHKCGRTWCSIWPAWSRPGTRSLISTVFGKGMGASIPFRITYHQ